jgi:hypothetical protein
MPNGERIELEKGGHKRPQKVLFKVERVIPHRGKQNRKVFIYRDGKFDEYLWMSDLDLKKNKQRVKSNGDIFIFENNTEYSIVIP